MGDLFSGTTKTKNEEKFDTGPSKFQQPYLDQSFGAAKNIYNSSKGTPYFEGDTYAGMSPEAKKALESLKAYAGGSAMTQGQQISQIGSDIASGAAGKALGHLDRFTTLAGEDATAGNIAAAERYADNPHVQGMIDANSRDVTRNLSEVTLPGIDRAASGTGNINSSRAGIAAGVAQRGAEDRIGDISAQIRGQAYESGLDRASRDRESKLSAFEKAAGSYSSLTDQGLSAIRSGIDTAMGAYDTINKANAVGQADQQGKLDAAFSKWKGEDEREMDLLSRYFNIVGGNQWGQSGTSSGTTTQKTSGNILGQLAGAAAGIGSLVTGFAKKG